MSQNEVFFVILAYLSEFVGTVTGVSASVLFVPLALYFEPIHETLVLTAALQVLGNSVRIFMYWRHVNWGLTLKFGLPAILFSAIGANVSSSMSSKDYSLLLGLFLMAFSAYSYFYGNDFQKFGNVKKVLPYIAGGLSGFLTGALGAGGAVRSLALTAFDLTPLSFTVTSTLVDFGGDITRLIIYLQKEYLSEDNYFYLPILTIVALIANWHAKKWVSLASTLFFRKMVLTIVFLLGCFNLFNFFSS
jgi:uncharacterized membrane protein YfcA